MGGVELTPPDAATAATAGAADGATARVCEQGGRGGFHLNGEAAAAFEDGHAAPHVHRSMPFGRDKAARGRRSSGRQAAVDGGARKEIVQHVLVELEPRAAVGWLDLHLVGSPPRPPAAVGPAGALKEK